MHKTLGIISIKGGVGKTTVAAALATDLAVNYQKKVLLVDANYSAPNLGLHMDIIEPEKTIHHVLDGKNSLEQSVHNKFGVDVIPGSYVYAKKIEPLKLKEKLDKLSSDYDFVVLDSSPSLNEEMLSTILASDALFVVSTPDYPTLSCSLRAANLAKQRGKPIAGIILNKLRDPNYELTLQEIENTLEIPVVARIPDDKTAVRSLFTRIPSPIYSTRSPIAKEIRKLNSAITGTNEKPSLIKHILPFTMKKEEVNRQLLKESFYTPMFSN